MRIWVDALTLLLAISRLTIDFGVFENVPIRLLIYSGRCPCGFLVHSELSGDACMHVEVVVRLVEPDQGVVIRTKHCSATSSTSHIERYRLCMLYSKCTEQLTRRGRWCLMNLLALVMIGTSLPRDWEQFGVLRLPQSFDSDVSLILICWLKP